MIHAGFTVIYSIIFGQIIMNPYGDCYASSEGNMVPMFDEPPRIALDDGTNINFNKTQGINYNSRKTNNPGDWVNISTNMRICLISQIFFDFFFVIKGIVGLKCSMRKGWQR